MNPFWAVVVSALFFIGLVRVRVNIGLSFLFSAVILGILAGMPLGGLGWAILTGAFRLSTLRLMGIVLFISIMGVVLKETGNFREMVSSLEELVGEPRLSSVIPASVVGFLPMPGGAMLSAPMVEEGAARLGLTPEKLTYFNFWFRHLWEYVWPLYPGIILSAALLSVTPTQIALRQMPMPFVAIAIGCFMLFRVPVEKRAKKRFSLNALWRFIRSAWYIWVVIVVAIGFGLDLFWVMLGIVVLLFISIRSPRKVWGYLKSSLSLKILLLVQMVMVFKEVLAASHSLEALSSGLLGVPPYLLAAGLPFVIGLLTGVNSAYVGLGWPILATIMGQGSALHWDIFVIAFVSGYAGVLLSPVHLCLLLTRDYFHSSWSGVYRALAPSVGALIVAGFLLALLWRWVG